MIGTAEIGVLVVLLLGTLFWLFALVKIANQEEGTEKKVWLVFVVLTHALGAVIYFAAKQIQSQKPE